MTNFELALAASGVLATLAFGISQVVLGGRQTDLLVRTSKAARESAEAQGFVQALFRRIETKLDSLHGKVADLFDRCDELLAKGGDGPREPVEP